MRIKMLEKPAWERGTYTIKFTFKDEYKFTISAANITALSWWLSDLDGRIINSRADVNVTSISNPYRLVLEDEDLQITNKAVNRNARIITLKGTYNSDIGFDKSLVYAVGFYIINTTLIDIDLYAEVNDAILVTDVS